MPRVKPHHPYLIAALAFLSALVVFLEVSPVCADVYKILRGSVFTGFFAVAGFLLSAKTLVILNMKKEIYEKDEYLSALHEVDWAHTPREKKVGRCPRGECDAVSEVYRPLSQVGTLLSVNIVLALITSFAQITLGLADSKGAIAICLSLALSTACLLACSVFLMWLNFRVLYADWERQAQKKLDAKWDTALADFHAKGVQAQPAPLEEIPTDPTTTPEKKQGKRKKSTTGASTPICMAGWNGSIAKKVAAIGTSTASMCN